MRPLDQLSTEEARGLRGVVFDLDDTLLDHGALSEPAFASLFRLREVGLRLIACTGRPAGWGEILQRQWPVDATVTENGAVAWTRDEKTARVVLVDGAPPELRRERRRALLRIADEIVKELPETGLADDNAARVTDVTLDIGEHRRVSPVVVAAMHAAARARGVRSFHSSVHLHLTFETEDKATGTVGLLRRRFDEDPTAARARYAFVGDSANDAAAFGAFITTFGVSNIAAHLRGISVPPRYVAREPMGRGFAAIAARLVALRTLRTLRT